MKQTLLSLLLIDDDAELCALMQEFFAQAGYLLECAYNGRDGLACALRGVFDLVILDLMLPIVNGFTVLEQLRRRRDVPIIMLTARIGAEEKIAGLDRGADDYLPKPFDPDELLARIRAVLRRTSRQRWSGDSVTKFGTLEVNRASREVSNDGHLVEVTSLEFDILDLLIRSEGRIVSRDEIMATLFERSPTPYDRSLDVHISHLRKKLENGSTIIRTIRGVGYVFTPGANQGL